MTWNPNCVLCGLARVPALTITDAELYVPIVTLLTEDSAKRSKLLSEGFKKPVSWNAYKVIAEKSYVVDAFIRELIDSIWQGINRLIFLDYESNANRVIVNSHRRYFLQRVELKITTLKLMKETFIISRLKIKMQMI